MMKHDCYAILFLCIISIILTIFNKEKRSNTKKKRRFTIPKKKKDELRPNLYMRGFIDFKK